MNSSGRCLSRLALSAVLLAGIMCSPPALAQGGTPSAQATPTAPPGATPREIEMGKQASEEFEKNPKIVLWDGAKDPARAALLQKFNAMAAQLGKASARPAIDYTVKVIEDEDINAFTLPNGYIYVYRGLLEKLASDDEMAALLSHEIGHNALVHALRLQAKARKLNWANLAAVLAMLAGGETGVNAGMFAQYLLVAIFNGYSVDYEEEADAGAMDMMIKAGYNPSALVTLMQRLRVEEQNRGGRDPGIFRTHPPSAERVASALARLREVGVEYNPRDVAGLTRASAVELPGRVAVRMGSLILLELAADPEHPGRALQRAQLVAERTNQALRANLRLHELTIQATAISATLLARGSELATLGTADAALVGGSPRDAALHWRERFRGLFWKERVNGRLG